MQMCKREECEKEKLKNSTYCFECHTQWHESEMLISDQGFYISELGNSLSVIQAEMYEAYQGQLAHQREMLEMIRNANRRIEDARDARASVAEFSNVTDIPMFVDAEVQGGLMIGRCSHSGCSFSSLNNSAYCIGHYHRNVKRSPELDEREPALDSPLDSPLFTFFEGLKYRVHHIVISLRMGRLRYRSVGSILHGRGGSDSDSDPVWDPAWMCRRSMEIMHADAEGDDSIGTQARRIYRVTADSDPLSGAGLWRRSKHVVVTPGWCSSLESEKVQIVSRTV